MPRLRILPVLLAAGLAFGLLGAQTAALAEEPTSTPTANPGPSPHPEPTKESPEPPPSPEPTQESSARPAPKPEPSSPPETDQGTGEHPAQKPAPAEEPSSTPSAPEPEDEDEVAAVPDQEARLATLTLDETPPPPGDPLWQVPNGTRTDSGAAILNLGHVDVASLLAGGELVTKVKDTTESAVAVWREPEQVVLQALPGSRVSVPDAATYRFLGTPGADLWLLPETQDAGLLWPGWSTEEIATDATRTTFGWTLTGVAGPGEFALFTTGAFGVPQVHFNTRDGLPDTMAIDKRVHVHGSWAFSAEGTYCLAFSRATTLADGTRVSDDLTLAMAVGEVDVRKVDPSGCATTPSPGPTPTDPAPTPTPTTDPTPTPTAWPTSRTSTMPRWPQPSTSVRPAAT